MMGSIQLPFTPDGNKQSAVSSEDKTPFTRLPSDVIFELIDAIFECNGSLSWKDVLSFVWSSPEIQLVFHGYRMAFLRRHLSVTPKDLGSPSDFAARYTDGRDTSQDSEDHGRWFWNICKPLSQIYALLNLPGDIKTHLRMDDWHCSPRNKDAFLALFFPSPSWDPKALIDFDRHAALWRRRPETVTGRWKADESAFLGKLSLPELEALEDVWHWLGFFYVRIIVADESHRTGPSRVYNIPRSLDFLIHFLCERGLELLCKVIGASPEDQTKVLSDALDKAYMMRHKRVDQSHVRFVERGQIWSEMFHRKRFTAGETVEEALAERRRYLNLWNQQWRDARRPNVAPAQTVAHAQWWLVKRGINAAQLTSQSTATYSGGTDSIATYSARSNLARRNS